MVIVRLVTLVFSGLDNFGGFMLFVLVLFGLFFMAMLGVMSLFIHKRIMEGLLKTVGFFIAGVGMAMSVTKIVGVCMLVGVYMLVRVSMLRMRSCVTVVDVHPRVTQMAVKRVGTRLVATGTVLT